MLITFVYKPFRHLASLILLIMFSSIGSVAVAGDAAISINSLPICMNFGCKQKQTISLKQSEWESVANWLKQPTNDPQTEREYIKKAIGWMEVVVGRHTPTHRDVGGDLVNERAVFPGQLDCIDEANNTTTYLTLFEQNGLLKYHKVVEQAYRRAIFDQHWAGQIEEIETGQRWVVDSWFQHNGYLPYIQTAVKWGDIPFFTSYLDSSQPKNKEKENLVQRILN